MHHSASDLPFQNHAMSTDTYYTIVEDDFDPEPSNPNA